MPILILALFTSLLFIVKSVINLFIYIVIQRGVTRGHLKVMLDASTHMERNNDN